MTRGIKNPAGDRHGDAATARAEAIISAFGANPARWPAKDRAAVATALGKNTDLERQASLEAALDAALDRAETVEISEASRLRAFAAFERVADARARSIRVRLSRLMDSVRETVWPGAPWWKPACALSLSLVIGLSLGLTIFSPVSERDSGEQTVASLLDVPQSLDTEQSD
jgi:hypothetical protein